MSKSESSAVFSTIACLLLMATGFLMASFSIPYSFVPYLLAILAGVGNKPGKARKNWCTTNG